MHTYQICVHIIEGVKWFEFWDTIHEICKLVSRSFQKIKMTRTDKMISLYNVIGLIFIIPCVIGDYTH